jgi:Alpha-L-fucosidase
MDFINNNWHRDAFFGMHYDLHAIDTDKALGAELSEAHLEERLLEIMPDWIQCDCKGHPGYTSWPTSVGTPAPGLIKDSLAIYRNVTKKLGIKLGVHYSGVIDKLMIKEHPEWAVVDCNGKKNERSTCLLSDYLDKLMIPQMLEVIDKYDVDGFWVDGDNWGAEICWCERCTTAFTAQSGIKEIPNIADDKHWDQWLAFHRNLFLEYVRKYADAVHQHKPDCMVCSNWLYTMRHPDEITLPVDYLSGDFTANWGGNRAAMEGRILDSRNMPWDLMAWGYTRNFLFIETSPFCLKTATHLCQEVAEAIALGGGVMIYLMPQRTGWHSQADNNVMKKVAEFCRARQEYCFKSETVPQVALLHLAESYYKNNTPLFNLGDAVQPVEGALHAMQELHRGVDILTTKDAIDRIDQYKLVILPEQSCISDEMLASLLDYIKAGGNVLATGNTLAHDYGEFFGVTPAENDPDIPVLLSGATRLDSLTAVSANGNAVWLTGKCQAVNLCEGTQALMHGLKDLDSKKDLNGKIIGSMRKIGKGTLIGIYGCLFKSFFENHYYVLRDFIGQVIDEFNIDWLVEIEAPNWVEVVPRKQQDKLIINLINRGSGASLAPERFMVEEVPPVRDVGVKVRITDKPGRVYAVPEDKDLKYEYQDGMLTINVSQVHIHSIIVIEN